MSPEENEVGIYKVWEKKQAYVITISDNAQVILDLSKDLSREEPPEKRRKA